MIIRKLEEILDTERDIKTESWDSRRLLLKRDGMGYSVHDTLIHAGTETRIQYKNHLEACYCIEGEGEIESLESGEVHALKPKTIYALDKHDLHLLRAKSEMRLICVFNPPVVGREVHDENGVYPLLEGLKWIKTNKMSLEKQFDSDHELHIGLLVLATDPTLEIEFRQMLNGDNVAYFVNRVYYENPVTVENLRAMGDDLTRATSHILPESRLDVVAYGCTSGTAAIGADQTIEYMQRARPGVACTTPLIAACKGFSKLGVHRIALVTPYKSEVDDLIKDYFEEQNISVVKNCSFDLESDVEIARLPASSIYEAACKINNSEVEGVFISCTALRAADTIQPIEEEIDKPVVTSNQALLWDALRLCGYKKVIPGYGELMEI